MLATRLIPVLLIDSGYVVQTRQFQITNRIHSDCVIAAKTLGVEDADEVIILDITRKITPASRAAFFMQFKAMADTFNIPLTGGGDIRFINTVNYFLRMGADKVCINTAAYSEPKLISQIVKRYGSQVLTVSIDIDITYDEAGFTAIPNTDNHYSIGTEDALKFAHECVEQGAGELLLNSITHDGMGEGYALETFQTIAESVSVPVIYLGGVRKWEHLVEGVEHGASGVAAANIFHYKENAVREAKKYMKERGINVRPII